MKKIVLLPKTDTVILCLPEQWIGVPVICKLTPMNNHFMNREDIETEATRAVIFRDKKRKKRKM
jgi:hypothetical protein